MTPAGPDAPPSSSSARADGCPKITGRFGSLDAFWTLIEPVLSKLQPRRCCEIGVERGVFTDRLLAWGREHGCAYVGIDPFPDPAVADRVQMSRPGRDGVEADRLLTGRSLDVLPGLERCGVYFIDGDHNYHTVRNELEVIQRTAAASPLEGFAAPVIFLHDVGWPFGRRDMYHEPAAIPADARQPYSESLGVSLEGDELIDGGLRAPGQYAIASHAGGRRNGVFTAVEDFLASEDGRGWRIIKVPAAYGLAILYRPGDPALPAACRDYLDALHAAAGVAGRFLESCEANFLTLYLYSEHARYELGQHILSLQLERGAHHRTLEAYRALESANRQTLEAYDALEGSNQQTLEAYRALESVNRQALDSYRALENVCKDVSGHNEALAQEYARLQEAYTALSREYDGLLGSYHDLQRHVDQLASPPTVTAGK